MVDSLFCITPWGTEATSPGYPILSLPSEYPAHRRAHSPKAHTTATDTGNAGPDAEEAGESLPEVTQLPHAQGSPNPCLLQFPVGWQIYYEKQEFQSQVLVAGPEGRVLFCKAAE